MEILLFKQTKDSDLKTGLTVAYKGADGEYKPRRTGVILDIFEQDGILLYNVDGFAYTADELKLITDNNL